MSQKTSIEWTDASWSPIVGCTRKSEGCRNCWSERFLARFGGIAGHKFEGLSRFTSNGPRWSGEVRFAEAALEDPIRWRAPRKIFVCSTSDLFHEKVPDEWIDRIFAVMALCPQHEFQCLTKRPKRMRAYLSNPDTPGRVAKAADRLSVAKEIAIGRDFSVSGTQVRNIARGDQWASPGEMPWPLPQIWVGVSIENQETADERIPLLLQTPAAVRWISYEPALGEINIRSWLHPASDTNISWLVCGGESGPGARPCDRRWIYNVMDQCKTVSIPIFIKQLGAKSHIDGTGNFLKIKDPKGGNMREWPADLRVRQWPEIST